MSKCYTNWMRLPNSRMDRQHRPKQFFHQKDMIEDPDRMAMMQDRREQKECKFEKLMAELEKMKRGASHEG